ncbi:MAG: tRNA guanosine(15) transglycosylase TgtA [Candidatus Kariarchaeaceae archaeon]
MFVISAWDGLAKIGDYTVNERTIRTPALFPVVDPKQQNLPIAEMKDRFGFDQVITSAYLMSKRMETMEFSTYPKVHDYLDYDGLVMMDSGAYQVMLYGDIELGVEETLTLQSHVRPDIGVIMDHPIGYDVGYGEAKRRVETTIFNLEASIPLLDPAVNWTLPIQGGKYLELLENYLIHVTEKDLVKHFKFFALGSVVPVMINQDYLTLVEMIALARQYLPVHIPLHLFGAGHPSMFALAVFLGCDTFDSAAYTLMAKDGRYMTVEGTYLIDDLTELPCYCPICTSHSLQEIQQMKGPSRANLIAEHNLYVSQGEIRNIRQHIKDGILWDLVLRRANSVPNLYRATQRAIELVSSGPLVDRFLSGSPVTRNSMVRLARETDLKRPLFVRSRQLALEYILGQHHNQIVILAYPLYRSIYNRLPDYQLQNPDADILPVLFLPPIGLVPLHVMELYPIGQMINEIDMDRFPAEILTDQINAITASGKQLEIYYSDHDLDRFLGKLGESFPEIPIEKVESLLTHFNDKFGVAKDKN